MVATASETIACLLSALKNGDLVSTEISSSNIDGVQSRHWSGNEESEDKGISNSKLSPHRLITSLLLLVGS